MLGDAVVRGEVPFRDEGRQPLDQSVEREILLDDAVVRGEVPFRDEGRQPLDQSVEREKQRRAGNMVGAAGIEPTTFSL